MVKDFFKANFDAFAIHVPVAIAVLLVAIAMPVPVALGTLNTLAWFGREQAQVGMKRKLVSFAPHPWKPWDWSLHVHLEWLAPSLFGWLVCALLAIVR